MSMHVVDAVPDGFPVLRRGRSERTEECHARLGKAVSGAMTLQNL